mmetsp:Transcript_25261/g.37296  ORF Transcript_25261/g.37296 Transcript_25261/m.37296 type:complete len:581 (-) Transcript_25261:76-1818(-)
MSDDGAWPMTNEDPLDLVTEPGLTPGAALLSCTGSDIQLSKGASTRPNAAKQKGRYVFMLPGIMSFRSQHAKDKKHEATSESENRNADGMKEAGRNNDNKELNPSVKLANTTSVLGRIKGLTSGRPTISIPFPNGGTLTLKGQHIETSSRFMMLNFKRGKVTCKDAVSSVLVFGEPIWSGDGPMPRREGPSEAPLEHYGGSERTVDGGRGVKLRKSRNAPIFVKQSGTQSDPKSRPISDPKPVPRRTSAIKGRTIQVVDLEEEEEDSDDYEEEDLGNFALRDESEPIRRSSRTSAGKKLSYDEKGSEEESSEEKSSKEKPARWRRKSLQRSNKEPSQTTFSDESSIHLIDHGEDEDDSVCDLENDSKNRPFRQQSESSRRTSRVRKRVSYGDNGSEEDEFSEEQSEEEPEDIQTENSTNRGKKPQAKKRGGGKAKGNISQNAPLVSKDTRSNRHNIKKTITDEAKRKEIIEVDECQSRNKPFLDMKNGRSPSETINIDDDDCGSDIDKNRSPKRKVAKHQVCAKSPGRRRRRRSGALVLPPSRNHIAVSRAESTNEGFNFDFSEEDKAIMTTPEKKRMKR